MNESSLRSRARSIQRNKVDPTILGRDQRQTESPVFDPKLASYALEGATRGGDELVIRTVLSAVFVFHCRSRILFKLATVQLLDSARRRGGLPSLFQIAQRSASGA